MKTFFKFFKSIFEKFIIFLKSIFLQLVLGIVAYGSFENSRQLGEMSTSEVGTYEKQIHEGFGAVETVGTNIAMNSGYIGGTIAMGIICSVCIIMIVWIEINKKPKS